MSMLAVLDLKGGLIVRGIAGERASYQPIRSTIADDPAPITIARGLARSFGFHDAYLADLDAIAGDSPSWSIYESVAQCGFNLIVDAGITDHRRAELFAEYAKQHVWLSGAVVGLESIASPAAIKEAIGLLGPELAVFSLDMKKGQPLTEIEPWRSAHPQSIAEEVINAGFRRLIVLDLAAVGVGRGPTTVGMCRSLRKAFPAIEIISGGGVRSATDVRALVDAGCDRVLVASALHDGRLSE